MPSHQALRIARHRAMQWTKAAAMLARMVHEEFADPVTVEIPTAARVSLETSAAECTAALDSKPESTT
jgi:hypothetical protein